MWSLLLLILLDIFIVESKSDQQENSFIQRRKRIMHGEKVSQIGSFSCFKLQWDAATKLRKVIDARLVYVEVDHREIPVSNETRESLERSSIALPDSPICINIHAENVKAEVVVYTIEKGEEIINDVEYPIQYPATTPRAVVVTARHWLERYEEILREADPDRQILKSPPSGSCELFTMEMPTNDLLPTGSVPMHAKFRQGICRGSCFDDPISRRKLCCKPAIMEDLEFAFTAADGSKRFRRISKFLVTGCGFR